MTQSHQTSACKLDCQPRLVAHNRLYCSPARANNEPANSPADMACRSSSATATLITGEVDTNSRECAKLVACIGRGSTWQAQTHKLSLCAARLSPRNPCQLGRALQGHQMGGCCGDVTNEWLQRLARGRSGRQQAADMYSVHTAINATTSNIRHHRAAAPATNLRTPPFPQRRSPNKNDAPAGSTPMSQSAV